RVQPQRLGVDGDRIDIVIREVGEVAPVEADGHIAGLPAHAVSAARMRAHDRCPLWKEVRSYFSLGEWMRSSSRPKPTSSVSMPSRRLKSPTIGIEPPIASTSVLLGHSSERADAA